MIQTQQLTKEEINDLFQIQNQRQIIIEKLGSIELEFINLENIKNLIKEEYKIISIKEQELATELQKKYGDGSIDVNKGEITSSN